MINIIGYGYVGSSIGHLCKQVNIPFCIVDTINKKDSGEEAYFNDLQQAVKHSEYIHEVNWYFVCVPTPSRDDGSCDTSTVESICKQISDYSVKKSNIIIKSTVVPGTTRKISGMMTDLVSVFFIPEFLTERNHLDDALNESKVIVGSIYNTDDIKYFMKILYRKSIDIHVCECEYAEMMKYTINVFLAQKVSFFNGIHDICGKLDVDYLKLRQLFLLDKRIGESHTEVPGPDGKYGFGGTCFTKEMKGMKKLRESLGLSSVILETILEDNQNRRNLI